MAPEENSKEKGKISSTPQPRSEKDVNYLMLTHSSHANTSKYPITIDMAVRTSHRETRKELWQNVAALASNLQSDWLLDPFFLVPLEQSGA